MEKTEKHLQDLADIKKMMERSTKFLSLSGWSGISAGVIALMGAYVAYRIIHFTGGSGIETYLFADAIVVLALALSTSIYFSWRKARKEGASLWSPLTRKLLLNMAIPLVTGGIYSLILLKQGQVQFIAGSTLIFYGLALVSSGRFTNREVVILGLAEILLGIAASIWTTYGFWFWVGGFGVFHILYGITLFHKYDRPKAHD